MAVKASELQTPTDVWERFLDRLLTAWVMNAGCKLTGDEKLVARTPVELQISDVAIRHLPDLTVDIKVELNKRYLANGWRLVEFDEPVIRFHVKVAEPNIPGNPTVNHTIQ